MRNSGSVRRFVHAADAAAESNGSVLKGGLVYGSATDPAGNGRAARNTGGREPPKNGKEQG